MNGVMRRPPCARRDALRPCSTIAMKALFHVGRVRTPRAARHLTGCADREQPAGVLDHDSIAVLRLLHEVRGDDDGHALLGQRGDAPPELATRQRIDTAGRLVEEQDLRLVQERCRHRQTLLDSRLATAPLRAAPVSSSNCSSARSHALCEEPAAQAVRAAEELEVLAHAEVAVERELLRHVADALRGLRPAPCAGSRRRPRGAAGGRQETAEHAKRRGLAGAVGSEQAEDLAAAHVEADVLATAVKSPNLRTSHRRRRRLAGRRRRSGRRPWRRPPPAEVRWTPARCAAQQHHEAVLERFGAGARPRGSEQFAAGARQAHAGWRMKRTAPPLRAPRRTTSGGIEQARLQLRAPARRAAAWRRRSARVRACAASAGRALREHLALVHHEDLRAALGFVHVRGADEHASDARRRTSCCTMSHSSRRDSGSTPTRRLVEQQQVRASAPACRPGPASASCRLTACRPAAP